MSKDARGEPVSSANTLALARFEAALAQFKTSGGNAMHCVEAALAADPGFVLGHVFRAVLLFLAQDGRGSPQARSSVEAAERLAGSANLRERGHIAVVSRWLDGNLRGACSAWECVLLDYPRDALALEAARIANAYLDDIQPPERALHGGWFAA